MTLRGLIFDLDGTIIDTESADFYAWQEVYARNGHELTMDLWAERVGATPDTATFDPVSYLSQQGVMLSRADMDGWFDRYVELSKVQAAMPGALELIRDAHADGMKLAVASNSDRGWVKRWIDHHGLESFFEAVVTRDDVQNPKPAPDIYLLAAERLGLSVDECVAIEDSVIGMRAALAAKIRVIGVPGEFGRGVILPEGVALHLKSLADIDAGRLREQFDRLTTT